MIFNMRKVKTGIDGFDELIDGGFPEGSVVLLSGTPGTGKTIFGLEFLHNGAVLFKEKGMLISFEEKKSNLIRQASAFGWKLDELTKKGQIIVSSIPSHALEKSTPDSLIDIIKENKIQRVVIDSLSTLTMNTPTLTNFPHTLDTLAVKRFIYGFVQKLASTGATTILVSHSHNDSSLSIDGVSEFVCDGIIKIHSQTLGGEYSRSLKITKMRSAKTNEDIHPLEICGQGIRVHAIK
jgi:KaiC/GvpD/RAD55 family RecA-like ATPase